MTNITCTGTIYAVNPDAPEEGTDIRHEAYCPAHPDAGWCSATLPNGTQCAQSFPCTRHPVVCRHCGEPIVPHPNRVGYWWHLPEGYSECDGYNLCVDAATADNPVKLFLLAEPVQ